MAPTTLPHGVRLDLEASEGWLMLGNIPEAVSQLENIPAEYRNHPSVLALEWRAAEAAGQREQAWHAAERLCEVAPECAGAWICQANSLRDLIGAQAAADLLFSIVDRFPEEPVIAYNLACFLTALADWPGACRWLAQALQLDSAHELKAVALVDPDLKPLWNSIGERFALTISMSSAHTQK